MHGITLQFEKQPQNLLVLILHNSVQRREGTEPFREARIKGGPEALRSSNFVRCTGCLVANSHLSDRHAYDF